MLALITLTLLSLRGSMVKLATAVTDGTTSLDGNGSKKCIDSHTHYPTCKSTHTILDLPLRSRLSTSSSVVAANKRRCVCVTASKVGGA